MSELFRELTPEERRRYYHNEWHPKKIPYFIRKTLPYREFAFDHTGEGPNDRKNAYDDIRDLEDFIKLTSPYAIYTSVALYERPSKMSRWLGAELVFDIDAKDLPIRRCSHAPGEVCPLCLEDGKEIALTLIAHLRDLGFKEIHIVYSGRGYHIRVLDKWVLSLDDKARVEILEYLLGNADLSKPLSYSLWKVVLSWFSYYLRKAKNEDFKAAGIDRGFSMIRKSATKLIEDLKKGEIPSGYGIGSSTLYLLLEASITAAQGYIDRKVTVDVKRILRLPSSLHSKVGLITTYIGYKEAHLEKFNPLVHAVPKFRKEEVMEAYDEWLEQSGLIKPSGDRYE